MKRELGAYKKGEYIAGAQMRVFTGIITERSPDRPITSSLATDR